MVLNSSDGSLSWFLSPTDFNWDRVLFLICSVFFTLRRNGCCYVWPKSAFFGQKCLLSQKDTHNLLRDWRLFGKRQLFFFEQLFSVMARTWLVPKSERFFWPEISGLGRKIRFLPYDPNFGQQPVCSPRRDCSFPTLGAIFLLSVPELWPFS